MSFDIPGFKPLKKTMGIVHVLIYSSGHVYIARCAKVSYDQCRMILTESSIFRERAPMYDES